MVNIFTDPKNEYWFHVSNQNEIPIFGNLHKSINSDTIYEISRRFLNVSCDEETILKDLIRENVDYIDILRAITGVSDKRMYLELSYIFNKQRIDKNDPEGKNKLGETVFSLQKHSVSYFKNKIKKGVPLSESILETVSDYLISKGVIYILNTLRTMGADEIRILVDNLMLPKEIQQEETKRRGHGAEHALAMLLHQLNVSYIPANKHVNPMSEDDPNVDKVNFSLCERDEKKSWSMDMIILKEDKIRVLIQGLIHTSDPGQYGVNKSGETVLVRQGLNNFNTTRDVTEKIELWGLVDGVGFIENPDNTIFKMIEQFSSFIQLKTLYKAGLRLHRLGIVRIRAIRFDEDFYSDREMSDMFSLYGNDDIRVIRTRDDSLREISAGKAWLYV